jgi:hypothetical protein
MAQDLFVYSLHQVAKLAGNFYDDLKVLIMMIIAFISFFCALLKKSTEVQVQSTLPVM